jgi:methylenetetrahydrofolate reductase (NADPH)
MTRIADLVSADGPTVSFEIFPPKNDEAERLLEKALIKLEAMHPSFISVTYGALGSTRERTREIVLNIDAGNAFPAMPHLTCVGHSRADIIELLDAYRAGGIDNVLALGGDPPADGSDPGGEFEYAVELVELVREVGGFGVAVAAQPEMHPRSTDLSADRRFLAAKLALSDFGITNFFWEAGHYVRMMDDLSALGLDTPVIPAVFPFINVPGALRMSEMNRTNVPDDLRSRMEAVDGDAKAVRLLGVEVATKLCADLLAAGAPGLHLITMNRSVSVRQVIDNLGLLARG